MQSSGLLRVSSLAFLPFVTASAVAAPPSAAIPPLRAAIDTAGAVALRTGWQAPIRVAPSLYATNWAGHGAAPRPAATAAPGVATGRIRVGPGTDADTRLEWSAASNGLHLAYRFQPRAEFYAESLHVGLELPAGLFAGGSFAADGERHPLPRDAGPSFLLLRTMRRLDLTAADGETLTLAFDAPTPVLVQDSRQWGPTFSIRAGAPGARVWRTGDTLDVAFTLAAGRPLAVEAEEPGGPFTLAAGDDWIALQERAEIEPGSALDFSSLRPTAAPAGGQGRVIATPGGHFAFGSAPDRPVRFYGANVCFSAQYLPRATADRLAQRMARMGYNAVRLHHYDGGLVAKGAGPAGGPALDPQALDQLDYLAAALKREGLYITTDLFVSRPVPAAVVWPGEKGDCGMDEFKMAVPVNERAFTNWQAFASALLAHRNPHTGLTWAEDPAIAWLAMINEDNAENFAGHLSARLQPDWRAAWNRWLARTYATRTDVEQAWGADAGGDPSAGTVPWKPDVAAQDQRGRDFAAFLADTQRAMFDRMAAWLRQDLRCRALLTDRNGWNNRLASQACRTGYDYVDDHFYVDHPEFLDKAWQLPSKCPNRSPIADGRPGGLGCAFLRHAGKPFTITEFNYSGPGRYRGVGGILTGAIGSLQDWDGIWRFAFSHTRDNVDAPGAANYFDIAGDPLNAIAERASVCLFLRGDLRPAPHMAVVAVPAGDFASRSAPNAGVAPAWSDLALVTRVGFQASSSNPVAAAAAAEELRFGPGQVEAATVLDALVKRGWIRAGAADFATGRVASETGELALDACRDALTIATPATAGGYGPAGAQIAAGPLTAQILDTPATVWASSLDGRPLSQSRRLLVAHLTDLQNSGARFAEASRRTLLAWGGLPHLVLAGRARIALRHGAPAGLKAWALDVSGRRVGEIPVRVEDRTLAVLDLNVRGPAGACLAYEIAVP
jgi:hypothetical protein